MFRASSAPLSRRLLIPSLGLLPGRRWRGALWALLIVLGAALIVYPKHLRPEYSPIQSLHVFPNLPLFGAFYYLWFAGLVVLLFVPSKQGPMSPWEGLAMGGVFVLVYRGMWDIALPDWWADGLSNIVASQFIMESGSVLQNNPNLNLDFPGLHTLAAFLSQVTGLDLFPVVAILLLLLDVLMAFGLYLVSFRLLNDVRLSIFSALLWMSGNVFFAYLFFYPAFLGLVLLSFYLALLIKRGTSMRVSDWSVALILMAGATIIHFVSAMAFGFVLLGVNTIYYMARRQLLINAGILIAAFVVPIAWLVHTQQTFHNKTLPMTAFTTNPIHNPLSWVITVILANLSGSGPFWATGTKLFWLITFYGIGTAASLFYIARLREQTMSHQLAIGAFLGLMTLSIGNTLISAGGFEFFRFLAFAPLFTVPFLVMFVRAPSALNPKAGLAALALAMTLLSFPAFLAYRAPVAQYAYYPNEYAVGKFVSLTPNPVIYSLGLSYLPVLRYNEDAFYRTEGPARDIRDEDRLQGTVSLLVDNFQERESGIRHFFLHSWRAKAYYEHIFRLHAESRLWEHLEARLSASDLVYEDGYARLYVR